MGERAKVEKGLTAKGPKCYRITGFKIDGAKGIKGNRTRGEMCYRGKGVKG
jgi:hypothetical protein